MMIRGSLTRGVTLWTLLVMALTWAEEVAGKVDEVCVRRVAEPDGSTLVQLSDGRDVVTAVFGRDGAMLDCHALKGNTTAVSALFRESIAGERPDTVTYEMVDADVQRFGRRCRKHARDAKRIKSPSGTEKIFLDRQQLELGVNGTKWCRRQLSKELKGEKNKVAKEHEQADKCCRTRHRCKETIPAYGSRYGRFNYYPWPVVSCECDRKFRACLAAAAKGDSLAADVDRLFFDVNGIRCFEMAEETSCVKHDLWFTKCIEKKSEKTALFKK